MLDDRLKRLREVQNRFAEKLSRTQGHRLLWGFALFGSLFFSQVFKGYSLELLALAVPLPIFLYFLFRSQKQKAFLEHLQARIDFYDKQLRFANGQLDQFRSPETMANPDLARDLDLGHLIEALDYCYSVQGHQALNSLLCQELEIADRTTRSSKIQELIQYKAHLRKLHSIAHKKSVDFDRIEKELNRSFLESTMPWKWLIPMAWASLIAFALTPVPALIWKSFLLLYVGSVLHYLTKTKFLFSRLQDIHKDFENLKNPLMILEQLGGRLSFTPSLKEHQASQDTKVLSRLIGLMSLRTNPILFYILNIIIPWDFILSELSEKYRLQFVKHFNKWKNETIEIEVLSCFANLKIYQNTVEAKTSTDTLLDITELSHPLLNQEQVVTNSFQSKDQRVFIITGSNMSGKSTFLRALGINLCLANIGAPVFAKRFYYKPMKLISCIRVSDSLRDGQSYFYAEVQRMKKILEQAKQNEIFFLIDEPLRGTNNRERLIGNQSYVNQILKSNGHGFLCTHDLELTKLSEESELIANYHFSEQWKEQNLFFDYKIKQGPSQSTNALKILEKEGLYTSI